MGRRKTSLGTQSPEGSRFVERSLTAELFDQWVRPERMTGNLEAGALLPGPLGDARSPG